MIKKYLCQICIEYTNLIIHSQGMVSGCIWCRRKALWVHKWATGCYLVAEFLMTNSIYLFSRFPPYRSTKASWSADTISSFIEEGDMKVEACCLKSQLLWYFFIATAFLILNNPDVVSHPKMLRMNKISLHSSGPSLFWILCIFTFMIFFLLFEVGFLSILK